MNSRQSIQNEQTSYNCLDRLPSVLIAECASYLKATEYVKFGKINRKIYTSIYSPTKIHTLSSNLRTALSFNKIDMERFKNMKKASIYITSFDTLTSRNKLIWKTLNELNVLHVYNDDDDRNGLIQQYLNNNHMNLANITKLQISTTYYSLNSTSFFKLISQFPMLEYLGLNEAFIDENDNALLWNDNDIKMNCIKIKGLSIDSDCDDNLGSKLINVLNNQLESLSVYEECDDHLIISSNKFPKLTELQLYYPRTQLFDSFKNVSTLKTVTLWHNVLCNKQFIEHIIKNQLSLKHLKVAGHGDILNAIKAAETTLFSVKNKKRESNSLFIEFGQYDELEEEVMSKIHCETLKLIQTLEMTKIQSWRIKINIEKTHRIKSESNEMIKWLNELKHLKQKYLIHYEFYGEDADDFIVIISNKECKICGYQISTKVQEVCYYQEFEN